MSDVIDTTSEDFVKDMFGDKEVRWYQRAATNQVEQILEQEKNPRIVVVLPTGAGKTISNGAILLSERVKQAIVGKTSKPLRVLFVAHKHRLLTQAERAYAGEAGIVTIAPNIIEHSSMCKNPKISKALVEIYYHSVFTDIPSNLVFDLVIVDEGAHEGMATFQYHLEQLGDFPIIFLTAVPTRPDGILNKYTHFVEPLSREQAVAEGWLAPTHIHSFVDGSEKDKVPVLTDVMINYGHQMGQTMIFVNTKKQVTEMEKVITKLGYLATGIIDQSNKQLDQLLDHFSEGKVQFLITCNRISEGVDVKGCTDVVIGRQIGSYPYYSQIIGRAARPDSDCNVWELINPLNGNNLDTTAVVGIPESHRLISKKKGNWVEQQFDYTSRASNKTIGIADGIRIRH